MGEILNVEFWVLTLAAESDKLLLFRSNHERQIPEVFLCGLLVLRASFVRGRFASLKNNG
jgi:hypothetical protein